MSQPFKSLAPAFIRIAELDYFPPLVNPLSVDAGPFQTFTDTFSGTLQGSVSSINDGMVTTTWTLVDGPGSVIFADASSPTTAFTVSQYGLYVFKLTAAIGYWEVSDETMVVLLPLPVVNSVCSSESGFATLCGFSEYTSPSTPPKKYRTQTIAGMTQFCTGMNGTCSNVPLGADAHVYSGAAVYSSSTCATTNNQIDEIHNATPTSCGSPPGTPVVTNSVPLNLAGFPNDFGAAGMSVVTTATSKVYTSNGICGFNGAGTKLLVTATATLSAEDTEADAMARAALTPGTTCTASIEPRGAGDFTFNFVAVSFELDCSNLFAGRSYRVSVDFLQQTYGGGSPSTTTQHYDFTASGATHQITDVISCPSGKQVTVQNAVIAFA